MANMQGLRLGFPKEERCKDPHFLRPQTRLRSLALYHDGSRQPWVRHPPAISMDLLWIFSELRNSSKVRMSIRGISKQFCWIQLASIA
ncbi:hypothetical protein CR513_33584, partial [Mucuna pruriens]